jgi:hypothetical protein
MARKKTIIAACLGVFTGAIVTFFAMNVVMAHVEYVQDKKNASEEPMEGVGMTPLQRMKLAVVEGGDTAAFDKLAGIYSRERDFNFYPYARLMAVRYEYAPANYWVYCTLVDCDTLEAEQRDVAVGFLCKGAALGDTTAVAELARLETNRR